jgi:hypothetical protein
MICRHFRRLPVGDVVVACITAMVACIRHLEASCRFKSKASLMDVVTGTKRTKSDGSGLKASLAAISACRAWLGKEDDACAA